MQYVGRNYVPYINYKSGRSGTLWEGRFKASLVDRTNHLLGVMGYIELNPLRAGMVNGNAY
jgi:putative transposase